MVGEPSSKIKSDQFKKVGVISQAEFENQRGERVGGDEERHQVATNDDDLQFELDEPEPDKKPKSTESDSCSGPGTHASPSKPISNSPAPDSCQSKPIVRSLPKNIDHGNSSRKERDDLYWLERSARFYPVPIRHVSPLKPLTPVSRPACDTYMCILL